jgi:hypothetical protein
MRFIPAFQTCTQLELNQTVVQQNKHATYINEIVINSVLHLGSVGPSGCILYSFV